MKEASCARSRSQLLLEKVESIHEARWLYDNLDHYRTCHSDYRQYGPADEFYLEQQIVLKPNRTERIANERLNRHGTDRARYPRRAAGLSKLRRPSNLHYRYSKHCPAGPGA